MGKRQLYRLNNPRINSLSAPIVGILSANGDLGEELRSLKEQVAAGFDTIKIKIGFDPERDASRVQSYVDAAPTNIKFRVDANQGYDLHDAQTFLNAAPLDRLQVVEQPLPVGQIDDHARLEAEYESTIMLDEEIQTVDDLETAAAAKAAGAVKFKLMKVGSIENTVDLIERARQLGFNVVLGNGVQTEIGCLYEAMIWNTTDLELSGEFNGWLKQGSTLNSGIEFKEGQLIWTERNPQSLINPNDNEIIDNLVRTM